MLPASSAPSVLPAPTMVCSSSMNRMIFPSEDLTSSSTAFIRSSNSPRNFAPAISAEVQREDGAILEVVRHIAADDTLGKPLGDGGLADAGFTDRQGLFLVLRDRIRMTWRISSSRPMTGSSLRSAHAPPDRCRIS